MPPDEVAAPQTAQETPAAATPPPADKGMQNPDRAREERTAKLIEKHAARAQIAANKEMGKVGYVENRETLEDGERESEHSTGTTPNEERTRAADGKFRKKEKAAAEMPAGSDKTGPTDTPASSGELAELQALVNEGQIGEALKRIGIKAEGLTGPQWERFRKDQSKAQAKLDQRRSEVQQRYAQVEQWAGQLEQRYARYAQAEQALQKGDLDGFAQSLGTNWDELNRKAIQGLATKDPRVAELEARVNREAQQRQELEQRQAQQANWQGAVQRTHAALQGTGDPRIAAVMAQEPGFSAAVLTYLLQEQQRTGVDALTIQEGAEAVLGSISTQYAKMQKIFGGAQATPGVGGTGASQSASREEPTRRVSPVKPRTQLSSRGAAEAHAEKPLRGQALMDKYVRQAVAAKATELAQVADEDA